MTIWIIYATACYCLMVGFVFFFGLGVINRRRVLSWFGLSITALLWPVLVTFAMANEEKWFKLTSRRDKS